MKVIIGETKQGFIMTVDDGEESKTYRLKWMEGCGIYHALSDIIGSPSFRLHDPRSYDPEVRNEQTVFE